MRLHRALSCSGSLVLIGLAACQPDSSPTAPLETPSPSLAAAKKSPTYVISLADTPPSDLAAQITRAGGRLKKVASEAGVAIAESDAADFATKLETVSGVEAVGRDRMIRWIDPNQRVMRGAEAAVATGATGPNIGADETFFNTQWAIQAIDAVKAWQAGARGTGIRVAVLDGGLNHTHVDLVGGVDVARSASFVPGFAFNQDVDPDGFSHATHVAGIVAARDNAIGTIGVAPGATIIGVKVLHDGTGSFEQIIQGIIYAATPINKGGAGAQIINMSLGATFDPEGKEDRQLLRALSKATRFAHRKGVVVIASAGNEAVNLDVEKKLVTVPAQSDKVIAVSGTGPVGFALGATNFSRPASYTNIGKSLVDFAAPGGDGVLPGDDVCQIPAIPTGFLTAPCWVFDLILSPASLAPDNTGYFFAAGTSQAAPQVAAIAALIIEENGGQMEPNRVEAVLRRTSDDLGKRGHDAFFGDGFVNAKQAIR